MEVSAVKHEWPLLTRDDHFAGGDIGALYHQLSGLRDSSTRFKAVCLIWMGWDSRRHELPSLTMKQMRKTGIPDGLIACESPFCGVRFAPSGMKIKPKRYCCDGWMHGRSVGCAN